MAEPKRGFSFLTSGAVECSRTGFLYTFCALEQLLSFISPSLKEATMAKYASLEERFEHWTEVFQNGFETPCVLWRGYSQKDGYVVSAKNGAYGKMNLWYKREDEETGKSRKFPVHWVALVLHEIKFFIPDFRSMDPGHMKSFWDLFFAYRKLGLSIDHLCGHSLCTNPHHLEWVLLSKNLGRKRWMKRRRQQRIQARISGTDQHSRLLQRNSKNVDDFISKILESRRFRTDSPSRTFDF